MDILGKKLEKEKKESLELAEASREQEWKCKSFVSCLFQGRMAWDMISPFPVQKKEDKEEGDRFLNLLSEFLKSKLDPDKVDETREIPKEVIQGLFEMGAFAVKIPKEYGGLGFSQTNYNRAMHLIGSYCGSTAALLSAHQSIGVPQPLIVCGTEEQKKKYLPRFRTNAVSGFALTEPDAGSDPKMMKTTAVPVEDGKYYLLNGQKLWCTNGNIADIIVVMALTPPKIVKGKEKKQITAFIVETNTPGFSVTYRCKFMGLNAIQNGVIKFENVKVPKENIILGEGEGLKLAFLTLNAGRLTLPAAVTGMSKWCLLVSRNWAKKRVQWGAAIGEHEAIAAKLSTMAGNVFAMDAITWLTSYMADDKRYDIRLEAAIAKVFCTEESWKIIDNTVQIRGGRGYETSPSLRQRGEDAYPVERAMRDSRVNTILEGSTEILHLFIAREALDFHLKLIGTIMDPRVPVIKRLKTAFKAFFFYLSWYPRLWWPSFDGVSSILGCGCGRKVKLKLDTPTPRPVKDGTPLCERGILPKSLNSHIKFTRKTAKKLARGLFHRMIIHQQKLVHKQNMLNRYVDIGIDLFAMLSVLSYAMGLSASEEIKKNSIELADIFCRAARKRIAGNFRAVRKNDDKLQNNVSKKLLAGDFSWLESDIIK